jgi:hypothetical protein
MIFLSDSVSPQRLDEEALPALEEDLVSITDTAKFGALICPVPYKMTGQA